MANTYTFLSSLQYRWSCPSTRQRKSYLWQRWLIHIPFSHPFSTDGPCPPIRQIKSYLWQKRLIHRYTFLSSLQYRWPCPSTRQRKSYLGQKWLIRILFLHLSTSPDVILLWLTGLEAPINYLLNTDRPVRPRGLTFTWWGCCSLCFWLKPTELAKSFLFCSCVYFCLYGPFNCVSFHKFSRQLSPISLCSSGISALLVYPTIYLFMKVSRSPDRILRGWLGSKYQLTN